MAVTKDPAQSTASGVTLSQLVDRVRLEIEPRLDINILNGNIDASTQTVSFNHTFQHASIDRGSTFSIDDEVFYVIAVDSSSRQVTALRGHQNTTAASHSNGALVYFSQNSRKQIVDAINQELDSLYAKGLYQMRSVPITNYSWSVFDYQLGDINASDVYDVQYLATGTNGEWLHLPGWRFNPIDNTLILTSEPSWSHSLRVLYKSGFTHLTQPTDDIQSVAGLQDDASDILVYGACARLTLSDEYKRNDFRSQGDTRRPSEVPTGSQMRSHALFVQMRDQRIAEERNRLRKRYPVRRSGW